MLSVPGFILLILPFFPLLLVVDKKKAFTKAVPIIFSARLFLYLILQFWGIFFFWPLIFGELLISFASFFYFRSEISWQNFTSFFSQKKKLIFLGAILIIILQFASMHYFYSGSVISEIGERRASFESFPFPSYSDEWVVVSYINESIEKGSFFRHNPLMPDEMYFSPSIFRIFTSFMSGQVLLSALPTIYSYSIFALIFAVFSVLAFFLWLRSEKITLFSSTLAILFLPYINAGSNVVLFWSLIPFSLGLPFLFLFLAALNQKLYLPALFSFLLASVFYPSFAFVGALLFLVHLLQYPDKKKRKYFFYLVLAGFLAAAFIFIFQWSDREVLFNILREAFYFKDPGFFQPRWPWLMLPIIILPFSLWGIFNFIKEKNYYFLIFLSLVLFFLFFSYFSGYIILFEINRSAALMALLLVFSAAKGFQSFFSFWQKTSFALSLAWQKRLSYLFLLIFFVLSFSYSSREFWRELVMIQDINGRKITYKPTAPISNFLTLEDLEIFSQIKKKQFMASPFKALAIGAATGNYPMHTKGSIVTINFVAYEYFMNVDCSEKDRIAENKNIYYVYTRPFNCPNFVERAKSSEGLRLYEYLPER